MRGVVWDGAELVVTDELEVRDPGPGEVQVRVLASGICHSDLNVLDGTSPVPPPVVLGHEAAGVVARLGPPIEGEGVCELAPGDPVCVGSMTPCGECRACRSGRFGECPDAFGRGATPFRWRGRPVRSYANVSSFAELITVRASQLVATPDLAPGPAALVGCAVSTGFGVVRNVARVAEGDAVAVFGVGGIGVNALQTARLQRAARVVAVDVNADKEPTARHFGADEFVVTAPGTPTADVVAAVNAAAGQAVDAAIECSGAIGAIEAAIAVTGPGGTTALVGLPRRGTRVDFDVDELMRNRRVAGSLNGAIDPTRDLPEIVRLARAGDLDLDGQVSALWPLGRVEDAIAAVRAGEVVRAVLDHTA
jgi:S-(hydroxymethyl)glutathione dehydrogenase/alcohol dehydrogenase